MKQIFTKVAWIVHLGESSEVIFASKETIAYKIAEALYLDGEIHRAPAFDSYAKAGWVPVNVLLENGWWYECGNCKHRVMDYGCDECANEKCSNCTYLECADCKRFSGYVYSPKLDMVFCSSDCMGLYNSRQTGYTKGKGDI